MHFSAHKLDRKNNRRELMIHTKDEELLFPWIEKQISTFLAEKKLRKSDLINLGIGDTCHVMPTCIIKALHKTVDLMSTTPKGYGPEQGGVCLREKIANTIYNKEQLKLDEIFITEGIANSLSLLTSLFEKGSTIGVLSPTYPVYKSLLEVAGVNVVEILMEKDFSFHPPQQRLDAMILCSPNNPTGVAFTKSQLENWVNWANDNDTLILFDGAYESFISDPEIPHSIYEIEGAKTAAIEMRSFSKSIGFSGLRLGYFVVPRELGIIHKKCIKIITAKTNGVSYLIQEAGLAALSPEGLKEISKLSAHYMSMTARLKDHLLAQNQRVKGGLHAPYLFWNVSGSSKEQFIEMLRQHHTITIPGVGFGMDGYLRLSGFLNEDILQRALKVLTF